MSLLVLPIVVVAAQEAICAVPQFLREASYGMGATKWQAILNIVIPAALPGICRELYFSSLPCGRRNGTSCCIGNTGFIDSLAGWVI